MLRQESKAVTELQQNITANVCGQHGIQEKIKPQQCQENFIAALNTRRHN